MSDAAQSFFLVDEEATLQAGAALARALEKTLEKNELTQEAPSESWVIYLQGNLGAGKTTLTRGLLHALGHKGAVKSPTYTLVEPYDLPLGAFNTKKVSTKKIYHFDLYRLRDPQELEYLGVQDYFDHGFLCLVEWPEQGSGYLPAADVVINLSTEEQGRRFIVHSVSDKGACVLKTFSLSAESK